MSRPVPAAPPCRINRQGLSLAFLLALASVSASADLVYEQVSRRTYRDALGKERSVTLRQKIYACKFGMRSEAEGSDVVVIVRVDKGMIYEFDGKRGVYAEEKIVDVKRRYEGHKDVLRAHYKGMSDEKKRRLAALLGKGRPRVKAIRSAKETEISGVRCRKVSFYENGYLRLELWLTSRYDVGADLTPLLEINGEYSPALITERRKHRGFPMRVRTHPLLEVNPAGENEVLTVEQRTLRKELFEIPEGFKKVPSVLEGEKEEGAESGPEAPRPERPQPERPQPERPEDDDADAPLPD